MSFKKQFKEKLIKEDAWISLTNEQRESIINLGEQQLHLYLVSYRRELLVAVFEKMTQPQITMLEIGDYEELADELLSN